MTRWYWRGLKRGVVEKAVVGSFNKYASETAESVILCVAVTRIIGAMEAYRKMLMCLDIFGGKKMNFIKKLPTEISNMILSMLDDRSLRLAAMVSHKWRTMSIYERRRRRRLRGTKMKMIQCSHLEYGRRILTFEVNEENGRVIKKDPGRLHQSLCNSMCFNAERGRTMKAHCRINMRV